ncbi:MAG: cysteine synthase A [Candidatus Izemoplasmatales bacterium]|jgi:cysteine synthase A|nr:cysteine synthase A [Candidatus Izemoplasmatales bacterium]
MNIANNITETIGNTPLVRLNRIEKHFNLKANLYAKVEFFNPGSSVKDRIALAMIEDAEKKRLIKPGYQIVEATSGNTGIGLAMVGAAKGYNVTLVMPDTLSVERRKIMKAYGANLVLTEGAKGMRGAIDVANEIMTKTKECFMPSQFQNLANPEMHYRTTGPEIWNALDGKIDIFLAGVGTGGTISGTGKFLKEKNNDIKIIAVEPKDSPVLSKGTPGSHKIQGIGAGFIPNTLDVNIYDQILTISNEDAFEYATLLPKIEGIFVGISSGAALKAAIDIALFKTNEGKNIVFVLPDTGERYLSLSLFSE